MRLATIWLFLSLLAVAAYGQAGPSAATLHVLCAPGFRVDVDGKAAGVCTATAQGLLITNLAPGEHLVVVRRSGYVLVQMKMVAESGTTAELQVAPLKLRRRIRFRPAEEPVDMTVESPPMFADDTSSPGDHNIELNFVADADLASDRKQFELPVVDINYGVGETLQLKYEVPMALLRTTETDSAGNMHQHSARGISNSTAGVKYRFYDDEDSHLSFAVYPQLEFRTPGSKSENDGGVAAGGTTMILPLLVTKEQEHIAFTGNAGFEKSSEEGTHVFAVGGIGTRLSDHLAILGEIAGQDLNRSADRRILLNIGVRRKLDDHQTIGSSIGRDLHAGDGLKHTYIRVSYQRYFGEK